MFDNGIGIRRGLLARLSREVSGVPVPFTADNEERMCKTLLTKTAMQLFQSVHLV